MAGRGWDGRLRLRHRRWRRRRGGGLRRRRVREALGWERCGGCVCCLGVDRWRKRCRVRRRGFRSGRGGDGGAVMPSCRGGRESRRFSRLVPSMWMLPSKSRRSPAGGVMRADCLSGSDFGIRRGEGEGRDSESATPRRGPEGGNACANLTSDSRDGSKDYTTRAASLTYIPSHYTYQACMEVVGVKKNAKAREMNPPTRARAPHGNNYVANLSHCPVDTPVPCRNGRRRRDADSPVAADVPAAHAMRRRTWGWTVTVMLLRAFVRVSGAGSGVLLLEKRKRMGRLKSGGREGRSREQSSDVMIAGSSSSRCRWCR